MSVLRNLNVLSQMRLDVPHIRLMDASVAGDFDTVVGRISGGGRPLIVRGFTVLGSVSSAASTLQIVTADSIAVNLNASASGSFLWVPPDRANEVLDSVTNDRVLGSFVFGAINYVGIDFVRQPDNSTTDLVKFKDPNTGAEQSRLVPLAKTLDYKIVIGTTPFSAQANIVPIAKITVNSAGGVTTIEDARNLMFRLGSGGDVPDSSGFFAWPAGRSEVGFGGADKSLSSQKDWMDAVMTRLLELGGGTNWFSPTADRNVWSINTGSAFTNGDYFDLTAGTVSWTGIRFYFDNSGSAYYNDVTAGSGTIANQECVYVDLDRTSNATLTAQIAPIATLGVGARPGSRWVLAWRHDDGVTPRLFTRNWRYPVGTLFTPATNLAQGVVKIHRAGALTGRPVNDPVVVATESTGGVVLSTSGSATTLFAESTGTGTAISATTAGSLLPALSATSNGATSAAIAILAYSENGKAIVANSDNETAVSAISSGPAPAAIIGEHTGAGYGVHGKAIATGGIGVFAESGTGQAISALSNNVGVYSVADNQAVWAESNNTTAIYGTSLSAGSAIVGEATEDSIATAGVKGTSSGTNGNGVIGEVTTANGNAGVLGIGIGNAVGVHGVAVGGSGVFGVASGAGGVGLRGEAIVTNGVGVSAQGTLWGVRSVGDIGINTTDRYKYATTQQGIIMVSVLDMVKYSGTATISLWDGNMSVPHYPLDGSTTARVLAQIRLPRGATAVKLEALLKNNGVNFPTINRPTVRLVNYHTTSGITTTDLTTAGSAGTVSTLGVHWFELAALTAQALSDGFWGGSEVNGNSGMLLVQWDPQQADPLWFGGFRIRYTYTAVDFMV